VDVNERKNTCHDDVAIEENRIFLANNDEWSLVIFS
jgi:hypothetical protein